VVYSISRCLKALRHLGHHLNAIASTTKCCHIAGILWVLHLFDDFTKSLFTFEVPCRSSHALGLYGDICDRTWMQQGGSEDKGSSAFRFLTPLEGVSQQLIACLSRIPQDRCGPVSCDLSDSNGVGIHSLAYPPHSLHTVACPRVRALHVLPVREEDMQLTKSCCLRN
jgi:hypothetical protein